MEPALTVLLVLAGLAGLAWSRWSLRTIVGVAVAIVLAGAVLIPTAAPAEVAPPMVRLTEQRAGAAIAARSTYEVVRGDSLWRIAARFLAERTESPPTKRQIAEFWPKIYDENRSVVGDDPCLIHPGQILQIPTR